MVKGKVARLRNPFYKWEVSFKGDRVRKGALNKERKGDREGTQWSFQMSTFLPSWID